VGEEFFHADGGTNGQTDMTKLIVAFLSFANTSKMIKIIFAYLMFIGPCIIAIVDE